MPRVLIAGFCAVPGPDRAGVQLGHVIRALSRNHTVDVLAVRRGDPVSYTHLTLPTNREV